MKKLSFHAQLEITLCLLVTAMLTAMAWNSVVPLQFGVALMGIIFMINPVAPARLGQWGFLIRFAGAALVLLGILPML